MQLQDLRKEYERCKADRQLFQTLSEKREMAMHKLLSLKESMALHIVEMHRLAKYDPQKAESLKAQIDEEAELIDLIKKSITELDHEIDQLGDETTWHQLRQKLISHIQSIDPHAAEEFQAHEKRLEEAQHKLDQAKEEKKLAEPLAPLLKAGSEIKLEGGFLHIFLHRNPKARLARLIHQALEIAEAIYPKIEHGNLHLFLQQFINEAKQPRSGLYHQGLSAFYHHYQQAMSDLDTDIASHQAIITTQEQAIETWLNAHT